MSDKDTGIAFAAFWAGLSLDEAVDNLRRALVQQGLEGGVLIPCLLVSPDGAAPDGVIAIGLGPAGEDSAS